MAHFRLSLVLMAFAILSSGIAVSEDQDTSKGGTIIGDIQDTTLLENYLSEVQVVFVKADGQEFETQSDKDGHFERAGLPAGQDVVNIYKLGYEDRLGKPVSVIDDGRHYVPLTMNISKNSEKYGKTIQEALLTTIISGILGFLFSRFSKFLNKRRRKYKILWDLRTDRHKQFLNKRRPTYNQE